MPEILKKLCERSWSINYNSIKIYRIVNSLHKYNVKNSQ